MEVQMEINLRQIFNLASYQILRIRKNFGVNFVMDKLQDYLNN